MALKVLILGGTSDGRALAERLARDPRYEPLLSFAGRTSQVRAPDVPYRVGGFGGVEGLVSYLTSHGFAALIDATHPFAARMSANAARAAELGAVPLLRLELPAWQPAPGDRWSHAADMHEAAALLCAEPRRVFLAIGRLEVAAFLAAPQHDYLIRAIDDFAPGLPRARVIAARGPFELAAERALLERERIEVIVSKNAGTPSTHAKLVAARELALRVILIERPWLPPVPTVPSVERALAWLAAVHEPSLQRRGV
jgi:precorrin-6A/cobalt-precorrin-6A reductase